MSGGVLLAASALIALALIGFSARRLLLLGAALRSPRPAGEPLSPPPSVTLVVPAHDEGAGVGRTLEALDQLDYPAGSLFTIVVDDASHDHTGAEIARWAEGRPRTMALRLARRAGKSGALNAAIGAGPASDLVAICDADLRPRPDWLARLAASFGDPEVGAATAFLRPRNPGAGPVARYAALESWTHQLVTSAGKDRLALNPPLLGASLYRRAALESIGGFRSGGPGEDIHSTVALTQRGWRTRFIADAVAGNTVVRGWRAYWHQHIRWARNVFAAGAERPTLPSRPVAPRASAGLGRRLESRFARAGYADRLVFAAAVSLTAVGFLSPAFPALYVAVAVAEVIAATVAAGAAGQLHRYLGAAVAMFPLDVAASLAAALAHLARRPRTWQAARRATRAPESA